MKSLVVLVTAGFLLADAAAAADSRNVLVLYSNNRLVPGNVAVDRGLRSAVEQSPTRPVQTFSEFLDRPEFSGEAYEATVATYLREKYAARPPDAIVVVTDYALDFALRRRAQLFPGVPIVHLNVARSHLRAIPSLPADVVGVATEYDFSGTVEQALRWHPEARRLVVVTGTSERDREWEARLRKEMPLVAGKASIEFLAGQPTAAVLSRLRELGADSVVFTPGYFEDGAGRLFNPRDAAAQMAAVSGAPVYGPFDTFVGTGVVGGRMPSFEAMGRQAAQIVERILDGTAPASLKLPELVPATLRVDWRQVRRWGIEQAIPPDAVVSFREPTFWEAYRNVAIAVVAVILLQAGLIAALLVERRRRRWVELAMQKQRTELAHVSRLAVAGELTASIAHEINQPLGAILTNADAAELLLQSGADRREELQRILTDIRRDDLRASDVIRRLRTLLAKHEVERKLFDLNDAVSDVVNLLRAEARRREVAFEFRASPTAAHMIGDTVQIQQVLINLVLNAMDAVAGVPEERRLVVLSVEEKAGAVRVFVRDRGHGIAREDSHRLFESFFSTKDRGMGLGLSIARTIVEAHGGRIWAESGARDGAVFCVEFPARTPRGISSDNA